MTESQAHGSVETEYAGTARDAAARGHAHGHMDMAHASCDISHISLIHGLMPHGHYDRMETTPSTLESRHANHLWYEGRR